METKVLKPVKIAVIAPTGAGKTALISTVFDYIKENSNQAKGYTLEITNTAARNLQGFREAVSAQLAGQNMSFKSALIAPDRECTEYKFSMNFTDKTAGISIKQEFIILDIPGAYINNRYNYDSDSEFQRFNEHLDNSRILWIPIDTPILMECETSNEKSTSDLLRCRTTLEEFCVEWAQHAAENNKVDFCNFIFIKCEKYFSHDTRNEFNGCKKEFDDSYGPIVEAMKRWNSQDRYASVAVETIGAAKVNTVKWQEKNVEVEYVATGNRRQKRGVGCLLRDAFIVAKSNVEAEIEEPKKLKTNDKNVLSDRLKVAIAEQKQKILEMQSKKNVLETKTNEMYNAKRKVEDAGIFKVIIAAILKPFGVGSLNELKEKIRVLEYERNNLKNDIQNAQNKLEELNSKVANTSNRLSDVEQEIAALDKVNEWFNSLAGDTNDSKYYRTL